MFDLCSQGDRKTLAKQAKARVGGKGKIGWVAELLKKYNTPRGPKKNALFVYAAIPTAAGAADISETAAAGFFWSYMRANLQMDQEARGSLFRG
jgi:hypothetical protein